MQNAKQYDRVIGVLRRFFKEHKKFIEVPTQARCSILAACEDPNTIVTYQMSGATWPLPQTSQMLLEQELLSDPTLPGVFAITTSYRDEMHPVPGRHQRLFPMFEFESHGGIDQLRVLEAELLQYLGFAEPRCFSYESLCSRYDVELLAQEQEAKMWEELGDVISLEFFPQRSDPFFYVKRNNDGLYNKIDVVLYGMETIGSAERSCNIEEMRHDFFTVSNGMYAETLFAKFGKERVIAELENFLSKPMIPRFGGGIGVTRLVRAMELAGLLDGPLAAWQSGEQPSGKLQPSVTI